MISADTRRSDKTKSLNKRYWGLSIMTGCVGGWYLAGGWY
jgi:hypothetical protein